MHLARSLALLAILSWGNIPTTAEGLHRADAALSVTATVLPAPTISVIEVPVWHDPSGRMTVTCYDGLCPKLDYPLITLENGVLWPLGPALLY